MLAICRGHQVLNVALGGTLHQHLPDVIGKRAASGHYHNHNAIDVVATSKLAEAMGTMSRGGTASITRRSIDSVPGWW